MKRTLMLAITALVAFGLLVPAANADINGGVSVQGTADFGRHFVSRTNGSPLDCNKTTAKSAVARGQGLFTRTQLTPTTNGVWSLHANINFIGTPGGLSTGTLDLCGWMQHVGQVAAGSAVGPYCETFKGHSGRGELNFTPARGLNLFDVGWKASAPGGTVPLTGKYQVWNGTKPNKQKKNKWGNLLGQLQFQFPIVGPCMQTKDCLNKKTAGPDTPGCGQQRLPVVGNFQLVQATDMNGNGTPAEKKDVIRPKTAPPACKSTANSQCAYDSNKFGKEPAPGSKTA